MALSQAGSVEETEELESLQKYRDAFIRNYKHFFTQFSTEEQQVEAANQLFNTVKTPSGLAKLALTLKLIVAQQSPIQQETSETSKPEESPGDIREKPAQNKLAREIELINQKIQELYELRKLRELTLLEQDEIRAALIERDEVRKRLKRTQDAAMRAKRYRIRKATLMSTDSDFGSLDTAEPAFKFLRSHSTNVLMSSDEDPQVGPRNQLTVRTTSTISKENSICLTITPTTELSNLNLSSALSSVKFENMSPEPEVVASCFEKVRPSPVSTLNSNSTDKTRTSAAEEENVSPPIHNSSPECQQCGASFSTLNEFIEHMRLMHINNNVDFQCRVCDRSFSSQQDRLLHTIEHYVSTKATYTCQKCDKAFVSATAFRQHFASSHTDLLFRCNFCLQVFTDNGIYQEHIVTHALEETNIECVLCGIGFDNQDKFLAHIQLAHERPEDLTLRKSSTSLKEPLSKNLKCFVCDERYSNEQELDRHRLLNHCKVPKSDRCAVCRSTLSSLEDFFAHSKEHCTDLNEVSCVICRQSVRNESLLKLHGEYHLEEAIQQTVCQICSKSISLDDLAAHILQHTFEASSLDTGNTFVCQCGEKFEDAEELQVHSLIHFKDVLDNPKQQEDFFGCSKCSKAFPTLSALQGHSHVHLNRRFQCKQCRQCFSTQNRLESHSRRHLSDKKVKCQICDKLFAKQDLLSAHMKVHESKLQVNLVDASK